MGTNCLSVSNSALNFGKTKLIFWQLFTSQAASLKIVPFDYIEYDATDKKFDKVASGTSNTRALGGKLANKGGKLPVLAGFYGI